MRAPALAACALVLAAAAAAPASADRSVPSLRLLDREATRLSTDGERFAVWHADAGTELEILDTATDRRRTVPMDPDCYVGGVGSVTAAGRALLSCGAGFAPSRLVDLRDGAAVTLPSEVSVDGSPADVDWLYVGRRWAEGATQHADFNYGEGKAVFYDWRSGDLSTLSELDGDRDIDDPDLQRRRYCRGFRGAADRGDARAYEAPYFLTGETVYGHYRRLAVASCDGGPRRLLQRSFTYDEDVQLSSGLVTWAVPRAVTVRAYDVRSRRGYRWRLGKEATRDRPVGIWPTRRDVFVTERVSDAVPEQLRIFRARLRR